MGIQEILADKNAINDYLFENRHYVRFVLSKSFPSLLNTSEEEDYIQEGLMALYNAMQKFDESKGVQFKTFAYTGIRNKILTKLRDQKRQLHQHNKSIQVFSLNIPINSDCDCVTEEIEVLRDLVNIEEIVEEKEASKEIYGKLLNSFKPEYQKIIKYRLEGKNGAEIGRLMGCSKENINQKTKLIRKQISQYQFAQ